ncbi:MAG: hypothetical protein BWY85_00166 [Firmicutes bacterium ADurb.Bin506]|nr:MAG: hypothetical protein BWY85_00166 [Firmicutes bacterium ADurb.Bin506]
MRLFHIHPAALPTPLLTNQHRTSHLLMAGMVNLRALGGMARYNRHGGFVAWMHYLCVQEMLVRGIDHDSPIIPLWNTLRPHQKEFSIWIPPKTYIRDQSDLARKIREAGSDGVRVDLARGILMYQREHDMLRAAKELPQAVLSA